MASYIGSATSRVDGRAKVTGEAKYAGEFNVAGLVHGYVVESTIPKGRIARIDTSEALGIAGVIDVLTHQNRPPMADKDDAYKDEVAPEKGSPYRPLYDDRILFNGQPVALVLAEDWETARVAASLVRVDYQKEPHITDLHAQREKAFASDTPAKPRGDAEKSFAAAAVRHVAEYFIPTEHHNPMELFASTAMWDDGKLVVYDKTQGVQNVQKYLCGVFDLKPDEVRVMSPYMGGGFGAGLGPQYQVVLAVLAARALKRPVRVMLTRAQMYGLGHRPASIERLALGANGDGTLAAMTHEAIAVTSQFEEFARNDTGWGNLLYKSANAKFGHKLVKLDVPTSCDMRAPGAATGVYGLECAMDELAIALKIDPVQLRLQCYSDRDQGEDLPYTSKQLRECYRAGRDGVRLGQAQGGAALNARRQRTGRLGHGDGRVGSAADAGHGPHRADGQWPRGSRDRGFRHRHRNLHDHGAGCGRHARPADRQYQRQARRFDTASMPAGGRIVDRVLGVQRHREYGPRGSW